MLTFFFFKKNQIGTKNHRVKISLTSFAHLKDKGTVVNTLMTSKIMASKT